MSNVVAKAKNAIRDIHDFPEEGIVFKDITPIFLNQTLVSSIVDLMVESIKSLEVEGVACLDARGFWLGSLLANKLGVPFIPIRKKGKLPAETITESYELEYGEAAIEVHKDAIKKGQKILIHDDVLATGGTALAAGNLIQKLGGSIVGFSFLLNLKFLAGEKKIEGLSDTILSVINYE